MLVLFSRKRTRYMVCEDYCSGGYLGGRGVAISPPAALLGLVRGMGLALLAASKEVQWLP